MLAQKTYLRKMIMDTLTTLFTTWKKKMILALPSYVTPNQLQIGWHLRTLIKSNSENGLKILHHPPYPYPRLHLYHHVLKCLHQVFNHLDNTISFMIIYPSLLSITKVHLSIDIFGTLIFIAISYEIIEFYNLIFVITILTSITNKYISWNILFCLLFWYHYY